MRISFLYGLLHQKQSLMLSIVMTAKSKTTPFAQLVLTKSKDRPSNMLLSSEFKQKLKMKSFLLRQSTLDARWLHVGERIKLTEFYCFSSGG